MGDRANIYVHDERPGVYLYTDWGGYRLPEVVRAALSRRQRWDDLPYLTRIIFSEMIRYAVLDETGYGISTYVRDNEHPIICINVTEQRVGLAEREDVPKCYKDWSFSEFVTAEITEWR